MIEKTKIVVIGGGGHSKVLISILKKIKKYEIVGYTDNFNKGLLLNIPYLGTEKILKDLINRGINSAVIGMGQIKTSDIRFKLTEEITRLGLNFPAIISPGAIINEEVFIDEGTVIMDGVVINTGTRIGKFSIVNTKASIDHDCIIGNFTHVAPGVTISGGVIIGNNCLIGTGASIIQEIKIESESIIAAGAVVIRNTETGYIYTGVPAQKRKLMKC